MCGGSKTVYDTTTILGIDNYSVGFTRLGEALL